MKQKIYFPLAITFVIVCAVLAVLLVVLVLRYGLSFGGRLEWLTEQTGENKIIDCENNFDCFIEASKSCNQAKMTYITEVSAAGLIQSINLFLEIKGVEEDKCIFYMKIEKNDLKFSDETIQQMLAGGATQEQIQEQEQEMSKQADLYERRDVLCKFNTNDLTSMLNRWKTGDFLNDDWGVAECSWKMFEQ